VEVTLSFLSEVAWVTINQLESAREKLVQTRQAAELLKLTIFPS
jgi:hypothetical protein